MYILNEQEVNIKKYYCGRLVGKYLIDSGVPLFSKKGEFYVFVDTYLLRSKLKDAPFFIKFIGNSNW